ncbi:hypothetical protein CBOM_02545 [Ceraceosorus bombacis]|uniref:Uncharacterized protein n=1 Tax=Ceraceosorus bombacis TaxID=401625 RepID=A0A0P1BGM8_9BASI|nr:hypothetical protein CBOM_02545 [Ceraceosorus bombacis]
MASLPPEALALLVPVNPVQYEIIDAIITFAVYAGFAIGVVSVEWVANWANEIRLLRANWRWSNALYFVCRACSLVLCACITYSLGASPHCRNGVLSLYIPQAVTHAAGGSIFILRTMAIWDWNKVVLLMLVISLMATVGCMVGVGYTQLIATPNPIGLHSCLLTLDPLQVVTYWVPAVFDTMVLVFTIIGLRRKPVGAMRKKLLQPTVLWYSVVTASYWIVGIWTLTVPDKVSLFGGVWTAVVAPIAYCRVFLDLRQDSQLGRTSNNQHLGSSSNGTNSRSIGLFSNRSESKGKQFGSPSFDRSFVQHPEAAANNFRNAPPLEQIHTEKRNRSGSQPHGAWQVHSPHQQANGASKMGNDMEQEGEGGFALEQISAPSPLSSNRLRQGEAAEAGGVRLNVNTEVFRSDPDDHHAFRSRDVPLSDLHSTIDTRSSPSAPLAEIQASHNRWTREADRWA